jgi:hypothetical protein
MPQNTTTPISGPLRARLLANTAHSWLKQVPPQTERDHALIADGLALGDRQPFRDLATRPAVRRTPTSTDDAIVLDDYRHGRSVLAEGGPQKAQRGPVDQGGVVNV